jgi:hypothetical protein
MAESRLRDMEALSGSSEMKLLGYRDEVLNEPEIQPFDKRNLSIPGRSVLDFGVRSGNTRLAKTTRRNRCRPI